MRPIAVIPARYGSSRFPGKPLALLLGRPMVRHVYERCSEAGCFERVVVATDEERIAAAVRDFGGEVALTSAACASGTDRVAEIARRLDVPDTSVFINVQGDEPAIHPSSLSALAKAFDDAEVEMATLIRPLDSTERRRADVVKVVLDEAGRALYFSRSDIPFDRDPAADCARWAHIGIYGYRRRTLLKLASLAPTSLERSESLEQLRALGHGVKIVCCKTEYASVSVDRAEDLSAAEQALRGLGRG